MTRTQDFTASARSTIPQSLRRIGGSLFQSMLRLSHTMRWWSMSTRRRQQWVRQRLLLDRSSWLFITGVSNSGTTILAQLLARHHSIRTLPKEGQFLTSALPRPDDHGDGRLWALRAERYRLTETGSSSAALRCMYDWSWRYPYRAGILMEKSPPNLLRMRWLEANFSPARFMIIVRNPYAVCEGICRRRIDSTMEQAARQWTAAHEIMLEDVPMLEHTLRITYEDLCDRPAEVLGQISQFLKLDPPFNAAVVQHGLEFRDRAYAGSMLRNFNTGAMARLTDEEVATVTKVAGPMMQRLGYEVINR